jgi:hypothetical protein
MHIALPKSRSDAADARSTEPTLGFLVAGFDAATGYAGGYLITTARGRPLAFHYTRPVLPTATHRILYGADLEPYVYGTLIGPGLLQQTGVPPALVLTDQAAIVAIRGTQAVPLVHLRPRAAGSDTLADAAGPEVVCHPEYMADLDVLGRWRDELGGWAKLLEPLGRVNEALRDVLSHDPVKEAA